MVKEGLIENRKTKFLIGAEIVEKALDFTKWCFKLEKC